MTRKTGCLFFVLFIFCKNASIAAEMKLPDCPESPNCVSSQAAQNSSHYIAPFIIKSSANDAWAEIKNALLSQSRTIITKRSDITIHAETTSLVFRFVDDIDLLLDKEAGQIHIRSASRTGHSDFDVNRKRVESIRSELQKKGVID